MKSHLKNLLAAVATGLAAVAIPAALTTTLTAGVAMADDSQESEHLDRVTLRNGRVVEGRITKETDTQIEMVVIVSGIEAPTTYPKSDIVSIERAVVKPVAAPSRGSGATTTSRSRTGTNTDASVPEGSAVVYHLPLKGHLMGEPFGGIPYLFEAGRRDVISRTPLEEAIDDAMSYNPAVIVIEVSVDSPGGFDGLFVTEGVAPIFEEAQRNGARIVFWVQRAVQGAAFLPMLSPEIYFKPDGVLGGIGDLGDADFGDEAVTEKQISLRLGHAEGIAIQNGYEPALVRAMAREQNWLAVRWKGGQPEYIEHEPRPVDGTGWEILTDNGAGANADKSSFEGNDVLNLDATLAEKLLFSKGTAGSMEDLVSMLDIGRDYTVIKGRGEREIDEWQDRVARAVDTLFSLDALQDGASGKVANKEEAGRVIRELEQVRSILTVYEEVLDPTGVLRANIDIQIEDLRARMRNNDNNRSSGGRGRRGG